MTQVLEMDADCYHYYSCLWRKCQQKKHKTWDGDGVVQVHSKSVLLFDSDGREIGKCTLRLQSDCIHPWTEGQSLTLGNKEIEISGVVSRDHFQSGRCFISGSMPASTSSTVKSTFAKPFRVPLKSTTSALNSLPSATSSAAAVVKPCPRHRVDAEGAVVMTRPPPNHRTRFNTRKLPIVDVVIDPILSRHLRPHQQEGVKFLYDAVMGFSSGSSGNTALNMGAILADEMGLGKTVQTIALIWTLLKQSPYFGAVPVVRRVLIVCPATLVEYWFKEFKKWLGDERVKVFCIPHGGQGVAESLAEFKKGSRIYPVLIINYERVRTVCASLKSMEFDLMVCDEGHRLKDSNIKTSQSLSSLGCSRRLILSGTPIQNDLSEFFAMADFCNPGLLGTLAVFKRVYEEPIMRGRLPLATRQDKDIGEARQAELSRLTASFMLRRTAEVNRKYLPVKHEVVLFCRMTDLQARLYAACLEVPAIACLKTKSGGQKFDIGAHFAVIHAMRKIVNSCSLINCVGDEDLLESLNGICQAAIKQGSKQVSLADNGYEFLVEASAKLSLLDTLLQSIWKLAPTDKVVIVSNFTQTLDVIENMFRCKKHAIFRLDGSTPTNKRMNMVDRFNKHPESPNVFLLSTKSGGVGLTLTGANRIILFDPDWNPAHDAQAMARVWRDGQLKEVVIYRLLTTGSIDEKIFQRGICKQALSDNFIDDKGDVSDSFTPSELRNLFTLHETRCYTHVLLKCACAGRMTDEIMEEE
eukprot:Partr_v1_DN27906_c0_g1_i5_m11804 putative dna repair and recombination protein